MNLQSENPYDATAAEFERVISGKKNYLRQIRSFTALFRAGETILDIGCGPGINARTFTDRGIIVSGIDSSAAMIELVRKNCPSGNFQQLAAGSLDASKQFDGICISFLIVHLDDEETVKLLQMTDRMTRPGGRVYISFMSGRPSGYERTSCTREEIFFNYFSTGFIGDCMKELGFSVVSHSSDKYCEADGTTTDDHYMMFVKGDGQQ